MSNLVTQQLREEITCGVGPTHARAAPSAVRRNEAPQAC